MSKPRRCEEDVHADRQPLASGVRAQTEEEGFFVGEKVMEEMRD